MLDFLQRDLQAKSEPFGQLTIERRVLVTPRSTISIANIAAVTLGTTRTRRKLAWNLALGLLGAGLAALAAGIAQKSSLAVTLGGVALLGGFILARFYASTEVPCLSIASNGGHAFLFTGQRKTLEEARRLLSDKINAADEGAVYRINFEKGMVQPMGHTEPVAAIFAGAASQPVTGNARGGPFDGHAPAGNARGAPQLGNGHYAGGNALHVDYTPVLPQIVDMQRFYAQRQDTQDIAERLNELEYLMRSGTPTPAGRGRLGQLVGELSSILGAYPSVVQIFQQAARIAGV